MGGLCGVACQLDGSVVRRTRLFTAAQPAQQVSAELAKKCREIAVKAHPTQLAGTSPYAAAQREYFRECVAKGGNMEEKK